MAEPTNRQIQISQRGVVVRGVDLIMACLQELFPRRVFPKMQDSDRYQVLGDPWRRGGTSPGGASFAGPVDLGPTVTGATAGNGNYFIGWPDDKTDAVEPQRIVWTPPDVGQERFGPAQMSGFMVDESTDPGAAVALRPMRHDEIAALPGQPGPWLSTNDPIYDAQTNRLQREVGLPGRGSAQQPIPGTTYGSGRRIMAAPYVTAFARTRIVPMTAKIWGSDWDDSEELLMWLSCAAETVYQGTLAHMALPVVDHGGWVRDEKASRGMHYELVINLCCPIIWPPLAEREMTSFGIGTAIRK